MTHKIAERGSETSGKGDARFAGFLYSFFLLMKSKKANFVREGLITLSKRWHKNFFLKRS